MLKSPYVAAVGALMLAGASVLPLAAFAQTSMALMPVLYNAQGTQVNNGNTSALPAGTYYLQPGGSQPVDYYGNGMYYNPMTELYGGSAVYDPNGAAGVNLGYSSSLSNPTVPSVPNTGAGGDSAALWLTLAVSGLLALSGIAYVSYASTKHFRAGANA